MFFITKSRNQTIVEPPVDDLWQVHMDAAEYYELCDTIRQCKQPWVRNANKDRGLRPARSHHGYQLIGVKHKTKSSIRGAASIRYAVEIETPYRLDALEFMAAVICVKQDAQRIREAFSYDRMYMVGEPAVTGNGRVLYDVRLVADGRSEYYRIQADATAAPVGLIGTMD